jgi:hypothetical protein
MHNRTAALLELNSGSQAGDLFLLSCFHVRNDRVFPWWNLLWQVHLLFQCRLAFLDWALKVDILHGVTKIGGLLDDGDKAVLDLQVHLGALCDVLAEGARRSDGQLLATAGVGVSVGT